MRWWLYISGKKWNLYYTQIGSPDVIDCYNLETLEYGLGL